MKIKKIIPCLDFQDGHVVKGIGFIDLKDVGDPITLAKKYERDGADEIVFLDISATAKGKETAYEYVEAIAREIDIPLIIGGGIRSIKDMEKAFLLGASRVSINSAAVENPDFINEASERFGSEKVIVAIDVQEKEDSWAVLTHGGKRISELDAILWAKEVEERGAGAILVTSRDFDGAKKGYDLRLLEALKDAVNLPIIASGGAGKLEDLRAGIEAGADAVLAASIFHFNQLSIKACKEYLAKNGIAVSGTGLEPVFNEQGLVVATSVDYLDNKVLMQAYMNKEAWERTLATKRATYFSRSRQKLWVKGEESGNFQVVKNILLDCDRDSVLLIVEQTGPACHTNNRSCFYTSFYENNTNIGESLSELSKTIKSRKSSPKPGSYTNYLFDKGLDKILKKVGEETSEVIIAAKNLSKSELTYEVSDLIYHLTVLLEERELRWQDISIELQKRIK
ncbi:MAG: imidazole glycerol phosphate synthase subunit HisF [Firmicutes bacterium]|nr:imidazole glycerol phosphate synthase subunit HisF [Bacillota bacterium]MDD4263750.1 imidazole glycerol phosphate synthase subunit HisF [Bacillota bacterium]MDD4694302.1 imidazole glycerol phosphate synthase subunit HisF [Bacillota bacterium]